jgi:hypothetical protein
MLRIATSLLVVALAGCGASSNTEALDASMMETAADASAPDAGVFDGAMVDAAAPDASAPSTQLPPTQRAALEAWLAAGSYRSWRCEAREHAARSPGAHDVTRICSNDALSAAPDGPFPVGAASVKELYEAAGGGVIGYAVAVKVASGGGGDAWYWYERSRGTVYAAATGVALCTGCHSTAGRDFAPTSRDHVFTVVR